MFWSVTYCPGAVTVRVKVNVVLSWLVPVPSVTALTVTVELPTGVPPDLLLEPQDPSHIVENPNTMIKLNMRMPFSERLRELKVKTIPSNPGNRTA